LFKKGKIESGLKNTNREIDNDFYSETFNNSAGSFLADDSLNNRFVYNENIYAAFILMFFLQHFLTEKLMMNKSCN